MRVFKIICFGIFMFSRCLWAMETSGEPLIIKATNESVSDDAGIIFKYPKNIIQQLFPNNELGYALMFENKEGNYETIYAQYLRAANTHEAHKVTAEPYQKTIMWITTYTPPQALQLYKAFESMYNESDDYKRMHSQETETESIYDNL